LAKASKKRGRVSVKDMKFRNDPMIRLYDKTQEWLQESGRPVVLVIGVIAGLVILYVAGYYLSEYRESKAQKAFAAALEKYNAPVSDNPSTNVGTKAYTDAKVKWQETAAAFDRLANDYSGYYGLVGRYYAGVSYLHFDPAKGVELLQQVVDKKKQPTSDLARFALAENYYATGEYDKAIQNYEGLLSLSFVPKQVVQLGLGHAYEKAGDNQKAVDQYFEVAAADRSSSAGSEAEKRLTALAPEKLKELPAPNAGLSDQ
jgi:tetratricopeptide (TPR) repeat protein